MMKGQVESDECTTMDRGEQCSYDGSDNYHQFNMSFDAATGMFSGTMRSNQCSNDQWGRCVHCDPPMSLTSDTHRAKCIEQTFPSVTGPTATGIRGAVGYTRYGVNIYGPMEAGFGGNFPKPCMDDTGMCMGGTDVPTCEASLEDICAASNSTVSYYLMLDSCGGHAMPYHYHGDAVCDYDHQAPGHSPLIGFGLDGVGIYGLYETNPAIPENLDTCNGHVGEVPGDDEFGVPAGIRMYHYHVTSTAPYTLGCYGTPGFEPEPIDRETCMSFYDTCNNGELWAYHIDGEDYCYDLDCPCFFPSGKGKLGRNTNETSCLDTTITV